MILNLLKKELEKLLNIKISNHTILVNFYPEIDNLRFSLNNLKKNFERP